MKIDDSMKKAAGLPLSQTQVRPGKTAEKAGAAGASASAAPAASVTLSSQLQALSTQIASAGVFDNTKVEEIKAAIAGGHFKVDPEKVANGLLETVSDLIHTRRRG